MHKSLACRKESTPVDPDSESGAIPSKLVTRGPFAAALPDE